MLLLKRAATIRLQQVDIIWRCRHRIARSPFLTCEARIHLFIMSTNSNFFRKGPADSQKPHLKVGIGHQEQILGVNEGEPLRILDISTNHCGCYIRMNYRLRSGAEIPAIAEL